MRDWREIRLLNLQKLVFNPEGLATPPPERRRKSEFAKKTITNPDHLRQMLNGTRTIGDIAAARLEKALGLRPGWMTIDHDSAESDPGAEYELPMAAVGFARLWEQCPEDRRKELVQKTRELVRSYKEQARNAESKGSEDAKEKAGVRSSDNTAR